MHHVQATLGRADLKPTSTYLNATLLGLEESMRRFGTNHASRCKPAANEPATEHPRRATATRLLLVSLW